MRDHGPPAQLPADEVRLRHRRGCVLSRQGTDGEFAGRPAVQPRAAGDHAEAGPVPQRRPRNDEPVPARRGLRHRGRRRDRPRHRSLRAVPRHRPDRPGQRDHGPGLLGRDRQGAARRVPRRHGPGHPAHHQRDQGAHPRRRRGSRAGRRRHHRDRRHGRRHRVAALPRGRPPGAARDRPRQLLLPAHLPRALHRAVGRAEDQADAALRRRAAQHRHPARRAGLPLGPRDRHRAQAQDQPDVRRRRRGRHLLPGRAVDLRHPQGAAPRGPRRLRRPPAGPALPRRRLDGVGGPAQPGALAEVHGDDRPGRQVHRPARRLPVGHRGAARRWLRTQGPGADPLGSLRRLPDPRGRRARAGRGRRRLRARRFRRPRHRGQARRPPLRAGQRHPDAGPVPRPAVHGHRVRPRRGRPGEGELRRVRPRDAGRRHRHDGQPGRRRLRRAGPGRHDAAGQLPGDPAEGLGRRRRPTARPRSPSATGTATRWPTPTATGSARPAWCSRGRRRTGCSWSSSSCRARCTRSSPARRPTRS